MTSTPITITHPDATVVGDLPISVKLGDYVTFYSKVHMYHNIHKKMTDEETIYYLGIIGVIRGTSEIMFEVLWSYIHREGKMFNVTRIVPTLSFNEELVAAMNIKGFRVIEPEKGNRILERISQVYLVDQL